MTDLVFMDTETLGLDPRAPIWEFAAVRVNDTGTTVREHFMIRHWRGRWLAQMPKEFRKDYLTRYRRQDAIPASEAARRIYDITKAAHVIGAVPSFDTIRLDRLLNRHKMTVRGASPWHYHLMDVENAAVGYLRGNGQLWEPPWKSDELSAALGVDPARYKRHTAMGDVEWAMAQWEVMFGHEPPRLPPVLQAQELLEGLIQDVYANVGPSPILVKAHEVLAIIKGGRL